ncbi:TIM44-like domain-containing protein, partial [Myxococcota bacterium]|nr:TIM44-like domain-containing protein [Myxococcota bacterium]
MITHSPHAKNRNHWIVTVGIVLFFATLFHTVPAKGRVGGAGGVKAGQKRSSSGSTRSYWIKNWEGESTLSVALLNGVLLIFSLLLAAAGILDLRDWRRRRALRRLSQRQVRYKEVDQWGRERPGFDTEGFLKEVSELGYALQKAWSNAELNTVRAGLSDGVYQRLRLQLEMMALLGVTNRISDVRVNDVWLAGAETSGPHDVLHVGIRCVMRDAMSVLGQSELNWESREPFTEYWSFLRNRGVSDGKPLVALSCPQCSSPIEAKAEQVSRCSHCGVLLNSGRHGWVLSAITQSGFFPCSVSELWFKKSTDELAATILRSDTAFSRQLIEDFASTAFIAVCEVLSTGETTTLARFATTGLIEHLLDEARTESFRYYRLFAEAVALNDVRHIGRFELALVEVKHVEQRVPFSEGVARWELMGEQEEVTRQY